jgi:translation initiation factor IF-3
LTDLLGQLFLHNGSINECLQQPCRLYKQEEQTIARVVQRNDKKLRNKQVRVISEDNDNLGMMSFEEAIERAESVSQDLVEVAPDANPVVCRILEYGKFIYEEKKREKEKRKKQSHVKLKEIDFRPNIHEHDYQTKVNHVISFLEKGHKVRTSIFFRGRERGNMKVGYELLDKIAEDVSEYGKVDKKPQNSGRSLNMQIAPISASSSGQKN